MKYLEKNPGACTSCRNCEKACSKLWFKEENPEKSCIRIGSNGGPTITVCTQCGECIGICPAEAIYRDKAGVVRIKKELCVGCFMCVGFCPEGAMYMHEDYTEPFNCSACGQCAKVCQAHAIYIEDK